MKLHHFIGFCCLLFCQKIEAQHSKASIVELYESQRYTEVINEAKDRVDLEAKEAYYVGLTYYHLEQDAKAVQSFDLAIQLNPEFSDSYFYRGTCLMYLNAFDKAIASFNKAISIKNNDPIYYIGKGDAFYNLTQLDSALINYQYAITLPMCQSRAYTMNAQVLSDMKKEAEALEAYYLAEQHIDPFSNEYKDILYNIGMQEFKNKELDKAEKAFESLLNLSPYDYPVINKMIQMHYAKGTYARSDHLRKKLYQGFEKGELPKDLQQMFCFDQFEWNDRMVLAFEKYHEDPSELYYKHLFYLVDDKGKVDCIVQTEYSPAIAAGGSKYVLGSNSESGHVTYYDFLFKEDFDYNDLKKGVIYIFEDNIESSVTSKKKKKKKRKRNK